MRLAARLRREIAEGTLAPGMPTPSITTLSQQYGHARQTCAKALRTLEDEGLLTRIPGLGYYVIGTTGAESPRSRAPDPLSAGPPDGRLQPKRPIPLVRLPQPPSPPRPPPAPPITVAGKDRHPRRSAIIATWTEFEIQAGEIETDSRLVRRLLRHQFPHWADLPIEMVPSYGTDHDIYRLGDQLCARMPRTGWAAGQAEREAVWLPRLAPHLPLALPVQVSLGQPADGYPFTWSVYQWLPGGNADGTISDLRQAATDLAGFVTAMRRIDTTGAPPRPRARAARR